MPSTTRFSVPAPLYHWTAALLAVGAVAGILLAGGGRTPTASAAGAPVGLGTATSFAVLAGSAVTNTGLSRISGDLGVSPGTAITGFPPGLVTNGTLHSDTPAARQAQADLTIAYDDAAGRTPPTADGSLLGGRTLVPGVYTASSAMGLTGKVVLDAVDDPDAVFIFQAGSTLITAPQSTVELIRGAQACNVFWQVGSSATLDTGTTFAGTILALTSASVNTGTTVDGRVLARNGAVTLDTNTITRSTCAAASTTTTASPATTTTIPTATTTTVPATTTTIPPSTTTTSPPTTTTVPQATTTTGPATTTTIPPTTTTTAPATLPTIPSSTTTTSPSTTTTVPRGTATTTTIAPSTTTTGPSTTTAPQASTTTTGPTGLTTTSGSSGTTTTSTGQSGVIAATTTTGRTPSATVGATTTTGAGVQGVVVTNPGAPGPDATLPRTGSPVGVTVLLAALAVMLGAAAIRFGHGEAPPERAD